MHFFRFNGGEQPVDADRKQLQAFLDSHGLRLVATRYGSFCDVVDITGNPLQFDGRPSDLTLYALDSEEPIQGGISHASLSTAECEFIYDLCVAAGFLLVNQQGPPMLVVPANNHSREEASIGGWELEADDIAWVNSASELRQALQGNFESFVTYRNRVIGP